MSTSHLVGGLDKHIASENYRPATVDELALWQQYKEQQETDI